MLSFGNYHDRSVMDAAELESSRRTFTVDIDAVVNPHVLESPAFRFRFLESSKRVVTPGIPTWALAPIASDNSVEGSTFVENQASSNHNQVRRFTHTFADVSITEAFAYALHSDPTIAFFLFDHPSIAALSSGSVGTAATGVKDPKAAKGTPGTDNGTPRDPPTVHRAFAGLFEIDVSSLLSSRRLSVEHTWICPAVKSIGERDKDINFFETERERKKERASSEAHFACLYELPSTMGALQSLSVRVSIDAPLLTGALLRKLNPITITIGSCRPLPGVSSTREHGSEQSSSPHSPLTQFCRPAYVRVAFFPDKLQSGLALGTLPSTPRVVLTPGKRQAESLTWNCSITFLSSAFDITTLVDALHSDALVIELHDRDLKQHGMIQRLTGKWEALYRGENSSSPINNDIFKIDEIALADWRATMSQARRFFSYGLAVFQLNQLLHRTLSAAKYELATIDEPYVIVKLSSDVVAMKRRASTLGSPPSQSPEVEETDDDKKQHDEDNAQEERMISSTADLTKLERAIREPGAYVSKATSLAIRVELHYPLPLPVEVANRASRVHLRPRTVAAMENNHVESERGWKFARMVIIFPYKDKDGNMLEEIARAMESVNMAAVSPGASLRSYQLTDVERCQTEVGELDIITGVQIIDSDFRMIILEGVADKGMAVLNEKLIRLRKPPNADGNKLFANPDVRFTKRLYTTFGVDLKRIKLRSALPTLLATPNIYMRPKVSEYCFLALTKLADLRACERLVDAKALDLFPAAAMLLEVESKYGESITLEDIYGSRRSVSPVSILEVESVSTPAVEALEIAITTKHSQSRSRSPLKAATDSRNTAFEEARRHRERKDFLREQRTQAEQARTEFATKRQQEQQQVPPMTGPVYMYSGQKLRTQDALQDETRERLAMVREKKKDATYYTYSREFQSLALSLVNPDAVRVKEQQESRSKWTTSRGFVYPAPRDPSEFNKHRDAPSAARCEELRQPFVDNVNHPKPVSRGGDGGLNAKSSKFSTLPSKDMIFGGTNGDGSVNHEYFRSVHLCGEGLRREMEEARRNEREEWERKLIVDKSQLKFLAHGNSCSEPTKSTQLDKVADILDGPAISKPLRIVKNASLPSGKQVPLQTAPVTILNQDEYIGCVAATFASTLRPKDTSEFVSHDERTGQPRDFLFPSTTNILTPQVKKFTTRKEIVHVPESEKRGLLWKNQ